MFGLSTRRILVLGPALALVAALMAAAHPGLGHAPALHADPAAPGIAALDGYQVRQFAAGTATTFNPDPIVVSGDRVFVAFQNATQPDGSDGGDSTLIEYRQNGTVAHSINLQGRCDGLRMNPGTHQLWATINEDGNSHLDVVDPEDWTVKTYSFSAAAHGGGYDDLAFLGGHAFIAASNPTLNGSGINTGPAVVEVTLQGSTAVVQPVLFGNAAALDTITNSQVTLNVVDPDSLTVDLMGNLVLVDQAGTELISIHQPGQNGQAVSRLTVGTQLDDTVWARNAEGQLWLVDSTRNAIYTVRAEFKAGTVYTETPHDSGVAGLISTVDQKTGIISPIAIGFGSPTGLLFVADSDHSDR